MLVEECVSGVEITVPVIGNDEPRALPIIEIALDSEFYDCAEIGRASCRERV